MIQRFDAVSQTILLSAMEERQWTRLSRNAFSGLSFPPKALTIELTGAR